MSTVTDTVPTDRPTAPAPGLGRWIGIAGLLGPALLFAGHLVHSGAGGDGTVADYTDYLADSSRMTGATIQAILTVVGLLAVIVFAAGIANRGRDRNPAIAALATGAGMAYAAIWTVGVALITAAGTSTKIDSAPITAEAAQALDIAGSYLVYFVSLSVAGIWILASTRLLSSAEVTGRWLTRFGYLTGVLLLPGPIWVGLPLSVIWAAAVSIGILRRG